MSLNGGQIVIILIVSYFVGSIIYDDIRQKRNKKRLAPYLLKLQEAKIETDKYLNINFKAYMQYVNTNTSIFNTVKEDLENIYHDYAIKNIESDKFRETIDAFRDNYFGKFSKEFGKYEAEQEALQKKELQEREKQIESQRKREQLKIIWEQQAKEIELSEEIKRKAYFEKKRIKEENNQRIEEELKLAKQKELKENKLKNCIKGYRNNKKNRTPEEIGRRYERQIGYTYEIEGSRVEYNGIYYGVKDKGIDIIVKKKNIHFVIQCKNYASSHQIHLNTIDQFQSVISRYKRENKKQEVYGILFTSNDNLDEDAKKEINLLDITHIVEPYSVNYPLIKCKKESMIYHLPCNGNYDRIKINIHKGDKYIETENEAVSFGFRAAEN